MSERLQHLLREEADRIEVPPAPTHAILAEARRRRRVRRVRELVAVAASVVVVVGGLAGVNRLLADDAPGPTPGPAETPSAPSTPSPTPSQTPVGATLDVSGNGVGGQPFGTDAAEVVAAVTARFGEPDVTVGPQRYARIPGNPGWFEDAEDPMALHWKYPTLSVDCWGTLCLVFGGDDADTLKLRGWELAQTRRWSGYQEVTDPRAPDVRLAGTGIRLGDSWRRLHAAYPGTFVDGGEGASVTVRNPPWPAVSDGVGGWRLSGQWDYTHPNEAPAGAVVTRLSGGEGPELGCC